MNSAGAKSGAVGAEVRNLDADRPQSKQRRGVHVEKGAGTKCGKSADKVRNLSEHSVSLLLAHPAIAHAPSATVPPRKARGRPRAVSDRAPADAAPYLVPSEPPKARREVDPVRPLTHGAAWPAVAGALRHWGDENGDCEQASARRVEEEVERRPSPDQASGGTGEPTPAPPDHNPPTKEVSHC